MMGVCAARHSDAGSESLFITGHQLTWPPPPHPYLYLILRMTVLLSEHFAYPTDSIYPMTLGRELWGGEYQSPIAPTSMTDTSTTELEHLRARTLVFHASPVELRCSRCFALTLLSRLTIYSSVYSAYASSVGFKEPYMEYLEERPFFNQVDAERSVI